QPRADQQRAEHRQHPADQGEGVVREDEEQDSNEPRRDPHEPDEAEQEAQVLVLALDARQPARRPAFHQQLAAVRAVIRGRVVHDRPAVLALYWRREEVQCHLRQGMGVMSPVAIVPTTSVDAGLGSTARTAATKRRIRINRSDLGVCRTTHQKRRHGRQARSYAVASRTTQGESRLPGCASSSSPHAGHTGNLPARTTCSIRAPSRVEYALQERRGRRAVTRYRMGAYEHFEVAGLNPAIEQEGCHLEASAEITPAREIGERRAAGMMPLGWWPGHAGDRADPARAEAAELLRESNDPLVGPRDAHRLEHAGEGSHLLRDIVQRCDGFDPHETVETGGREARLGIEDHGPGGRGRGGVQLVTATGELAELRLGTCLPDGGGLTRSEDA